MGSNFDSKEKVQSIIVYPLKLVFSFRKCTEVITLVNENCFKINFTLSTTRAGNKALFAADLTSGSIDANSEEKVTIEFKGNQDSPTFPIDITFQDPVSGWQEKKQIFWYYVKNLDENQNETTNFKNDDNLDLYPTSHFSQAINEDLKKLLAPLSLTIFILSLINFSYAFYIIFFGPVDSTWINLVNKYHLQEISIRCSSWYEAHKLLHNFTCKLD